MSLDIGATTANNLLLSVHHGSFVSPFSVLGTNVITIPTYATEPYNVSHSMVMELEFGERLARWTPQRPCEEEVTYEEYHDNRKTFME